MSSLMKNLLIWLAMITPLLASIALDNQGLLTVSVVAVLTYNVVQAFALIGVLCLISGVGKEPKDTSIVAAAVAKLDGRPWVLKALSWAQTIILIAGLAYAGAAITAFGTAMLVAAMQLTLAVARDRLKRVTA